MVGRPASKSVVVRRLRCVSGKLRAPAMCSDAYSSAGSTSSRSAPSSSRRWTAVWSIGVGMVVPPFVVGQDHANPRPPSPGGRSIRRARLLHPPLGELGATAVRDKTDDPEVVEGLGALVGRRRVLRPALDEAEVAGDRQDPPVERP